MAFYEEGTSTRSESQLTIHGSSTQSRLTGAIHQRLRNLSEAKGKQPSVQSQILHGDFNVESSFYHFAGFLIQKRNFIQLRDLSCLYELLHSRENHASTLVSFIPPAPHIFLPSCRKYFPIISKRHWRWRSCMRS
jgi:hypothetical protein